MEIWRPGRALQRIVPIAIPMSGNRGREEQWRETRIVEGFEPSIKNPRWFRERSSNLMEVKDTFSFRVKNSKDGEPMIGDLSVGLGIPVTAISPPPQFENNFNYGNFSITLTSILSSTWSRAPGPCSICLIEESADPIRRQHNNKRQVVLCSWDLMYLPSCGQQESLSFTNSLNT